MELIGNARKSYEECTTTSIPPRFKNALYAQ